MKWYDQALAIMIFALTMTILTIIGVGASRDVADYYNIPEPPPCAAEFGATCPVAGK